MSGFAHGMPGASAEEESNAVDNHAVSRFFFRVGRFFRVDGDAGAVGRDRARGVPGNRNATRTIL
jgi:hypothetical protein